jgi:hypothetical protein
MTDLRGPRDVPPPGHDHHVLDAGGVLSTASSAFRLSGTTFPRRYPPSAVIRTFASASLIRSASDSGLNPPKTTEWIAPIRAQASIAIAASGIMGR